MRETIVDRHGEVRCPVCGANQFTDKRTGKAKVIGVVTVGVGVLAMPRRLRCRGCGEHLKPGSVVPSEPEPPESPAAAEPRGPRPTRAAIREERAAAVENREP